MMIAKKKRPLPGCVMQAFRIPKCITKMMKAYWSQDNVVQARLYNGLLQETERTIQSKYVRAR